MNPFLDIEIELVNRFSDDRGRTFARSFEEFVSRIVHAINECLANTPEGNELLYAALTRAEEKGMSPEEWKQEYISILKAMFFLALDGCHPLKDEFARHTYDLLRREN